MASSVDGLAGAAAVPVFKSVANAQVGCNRSTIMSQHVISGDAQLTGISESGGCRDPTLPANHRWPTASTASRSLASARSKACSLAANSAAYTVSTGTIKRLIHRYLEHRIKRRALRLGSAENKIVYEGRRWCDATERELIGDIKNIHGSHLW
jgi:hypothetical protein